MNKEWLGQIASSIEAKHGAETRSRIFGDLHTVSGDHASICEFFLFRVNEIYQLKICGAILNAAFEYDLFSFEHYLDAFNHPCVRFYLAEYKGIPAGACMSIIDNDIVDIGWVGTLKGFRIIGIRGRGQCLLKMKGNRFRDRSE